MNTKRRMQIEKEDLLGGGNRNESKWDRVPFMNGNNTLSHDWETIMKLNDITPDIQSHLVKVYVALMGMIASAMAGASFVISTGGVSPVISLLGSLVSLGMIIWIYVDGDIENIPRRTAMICTLGVFEGVSASYLVNAAINVDPYIIATALFCTLAIFTCFSLAAIVSQRRSYLYLGGFLSSAILVLIVIGLSNIFFHSIQLYIMHLYGGLVIFSVYVIYDTQVIIEKAAQGSRDFAAHATDLFIDFMAIFIRIVIILLRNKKSGSSRSSRHPSNAFDL